MSLSCCKLAFAVYLTTRPFSCKLFNLGSGGTLPTHAFTRVPPTLIVQEPQSPFLQLYFGLNPALAQAFLSGDPGLASTIFPPKFNFVISHTTKEGRAWFALPTKAASTEKRAAKIIAIENINDLMFKSNLITVRNPRKL